MRRGKVALAVFYSLVLVGVSGALGFALRAATPPELLRPGSAEISAPVVPLEFDDSRRVQVRLVTAEPQALLAQTHGTLTASWCQTGKTIASGEIGWRVNGLPLIALHTTVPLYRDLIHGDEGEDVTALQQELVRLGHLSPEVVDGYYGWNTSTAVRNLREATGGKRGDSMAQHAEFVWLPAQEIADVVCDITIGQQVTAGAALASADGPIQRLEIVTMPENLAAGDRVLRLENIIAPVHLSGVVNDATFLAELASSAPQLVAEMRKDPEATITATMLLTVPRAAHTVPAGAVINAGEARCVQTGNTETVPIQLLGSAVGTAVVVFANVSHVPEHVRIGSGVTATNCG